MAVPDQPTDSISGDAATPTAELADVPGALRQAYPLALARLVRLMRGLDEALEVLHQAVERALTLWPERGIPEQPQAWLVTVARNVHTDNHRYIQRRRQVPVSELDVVCPWSPRLIALWQPDSWGDDLRADLAIPAPERALLERARSVAGLRKAEAFLSLPVTVRAGGQSGAALLEALPDDSTLEVPVDVDGRRLRIGTGGIVLSSGLADKLGISPGDSVELELEGLPRPIHARLDALSDVAVGSSVVMRLPDARAAFSLGPVANSVVMTVAPDARDRARDSLADWPAIARVQDMAGMRGKTEALMGLSWLMLGVMLVFSIVLASAILFNTANLGVLERERELATMRTLGVGMGAITSSLTLQHSLVALAGLLAGLPLSALATRLLLQSFESELFSLPFVWSGKTVAVSIVGVLAVLLLSQWPGLRHVGKLSLAEAVRARS